MSATGQVRVARSAASGRFVSRAEAEANPGTTVVEVVPSARQHKHRIEALEREVATLRAAHREVYGHLVGITFPGRESSHDIIEARRIAGVHGEVLRVSEG